MDGSEFVLKHRVAIAYLRSGELGALLGIWVSATTLGPEIVSIRAIDKFSRYDSGFKRTGFFWGIEDCDSLAPT